MKSSIYISSEKIEVIGYSYHLRGVSVKQVLTCPIPEGTMINGKITDPSQLISCLASLRSQSPRLFANSTLIVDGNFVFSKRIVVPKLSKKQYQLLVREDFTNAAESSEDLICDYHLLSGSGTGTAILACASEKSEIESYISVFKEAGIKLKAIRVGVEAIQNYVNERPDLREKTFVINVIDGITMLSMIFQNGINVFMSRTRLYSEEHEQLIQSILKNLSGFIQFNKSEKFNDIESSFYLGLTDADMKLMKEINPYPDIKLDMLNIFNNVNGSEKLSEHSHFAYLNTLLSPKSIDFIRSYHMLDKLKKQNRPKKLWIPILAGLTAVLACPVVYFLLQTASVDADITELNDYLTSETLVAKSEELDRIIEQSSYYASICNKFKEKKEAESSEASVSNEMLDLITQTSGDRVSVNQLNFQKSTGMIRVNGSSATETDSAEYVESLKKNDAIKSINYTGYSYGITGEYNFSIDVELVVREVGQ